MATDESKPTAAVAGPSKSLYNTDRRKLTPVTRDLHTAHHDPVKRTVVIRRSKTAQDRSRLLIGSGLSHVGYEDEEIVEEGNEEGVEGVEEGETIGEFPDSVLVEAQKVSSKVRPLTSTGQADAAAGREVNIFDDSEFDTDLETEPATAAKQRSPSPDSSIDERRASQTSSTRRKSASSAASTDAAPKRSSAHDDYIKTNYLESCRRAGLVPVSHFVRNFDNPSLSINHHGVGADGMGQMAKALMFNSKVTNLTMTDNWLGRVGGFYVCRLLKENCFISDLDLSDNRLDTSFCFYLSECLNFNRTVTKLDLSGNKFNAKAVQHLSTIVATNTNILSMSLSRCGLDSAAGAILGPTIAENPCMLYLDLSWNSICRKGALAIAKGLKTNVYLKELNLGWNGFANDGSKAMGDALKANKDLEILDLSNNRITAEGAVLLGKGLAINEGLKTLRLGRNIMKSAGCYGICAAVLKNVNSKIETLDFSDIIVNKDFLDIVQELKNAVLEQRQIKVITGCDIPALKPKKRVHPMVKLRMYVEKHKLNLYEFFSRFDKDGSMSVSYDEFREGIRDMGINLQDEEIAQLIQELDRDGDGDINYSEMVLGAELGQ